MPNLQPSKLTWRPLKSICNIEDLLARSKPPDPPAHTLKSLCPTDHQIQWHRNVCTSCRHSLSNLIKFCTDSPSPKFDPQKTSCSLIRACKASFHEVVCHGLCCMCTEYTNVIEPWQTNDERLWDIPGSTLQRIGAKQLSLCAVSSPLLLYDSSKQAKCVPMYLLGDADRVYMVGLSRTAISLPQHVCSALIYRSFERLRYSSSSNSKNIQWNGSLPKAFRVIDVEHQSIVPFQADTEYFAVSYMWENQYPNSHKKSIYTAKELATPNSLSRLPIPGLLQDCLDLCRYLGWRYVWIDRYCILQHDDNDKQDNIPRMAAIYRQASCTIICNFDNQNICGIPGFSKIPFGSWLGWNTRYNNRGWTFQERMFATPRLVFSMHSWELENQDILLQFEPQMSSKSSVIQRAKHKLKRNSVWDWESDRRTLANQFFLPALLESLSQYTRTRTTMAEDRVNAFLGLQTYLEERWKIPFIAGLPLPHLFSFILWFPDADEDKRPMYVRNDAPSWSWLAQEMPIEYSYASYLIRPVDVLGIESACAISVEDNNILNLDRPAPIGWLDAEYDVLRKYLRDQAGIAHGILMVAEYFQRGLLGNGYYMMRLVVSELDAKSYVDLRLEVVEKLIVDGKGILVVRRVTRGQTVDNGFFSGISAEEIAHDRLRELGFERKLLFWI